MTIPRSPKEALEALTRAAGRLRADGGDAMFLTRASGLQAAREVENVAAWLVTLCPDVPEVGENPLRLAGDLHRRPAGTPVHKSAEDLLFTDLVWDRGELELVRYDASHERGAGLSNGKGVHGSYDTWPIRRLVFSVPDAMDIVAGYEALDWLSRGCPTPKGAVQAVAIAAGGDMYPLTWKGRDD